MTNRLNITVGTNSTVEIYSDKVSPGFAGFSIFLSAWIIISNCFVLICFIRHRKSLIKTTFMMQLLALNISDLIVGFSMLLVYLTAFTTKFSFEVCLSKYVLALSAQAVEQFNILGICLNRLSIVGRMATPGTSPKKTKLVLAFSVCIWITSLGTYSVLFGIWAAHRRVLYNCSLNELFQENYKKYALYSISAYILSTALINFVYCSVIVKLAVSSRRRIEVTSESLPNNISVTHQIMPAEYSSNGLINYSPTPETWPKINDEMNSHSQSEQKNEKDATRKPTNEPLDTFTNKIKDSDKDSDERSKHEALRRYDSSRRILSENQIKARKDENDVSEQDDDTRRNSLFNKPTFKSQRKALITIGTF